MSSILVSGLINIEVTLRVDCFPIEYSPVRYPFHGVGSSVSGVGYNISKALTTLGDKVRFVSITGQDGAASLVQANLDREGIPGKYVIRGMEHTPHSVILYDEQGRRQINVDLKDVQEQGYPEALFDQALETCELAVLCNVNYSRPLLHRAKRAGKPIATDVHTLANLHDAYNRDFMAAADILFMSDELLPVPPAVWARKVLDAYGPEIVVIGLGAEGALLAVRRDGFVARIPAVSPRPIVNTIGAGDALFSAFVHYYCRDRDPYQAIQKAVVFAGYKIGTKGAAEGFVSEAELERLYGRLTTSGEISTALGPR
ncbi:MAG: carbohydrate kinase family protein [Anaerolineae bacterium]|jgi:ribokinase